MKYVVAIPPNAKVALAIVGIIIGLLAPTCAGASALAQCSYIDGFTPGAVACVPYTSVSPDGDYHRDYRDAECLVFLYTELVANISNCSSGAWDGKSCRPP